MDWTTISGLRRSMLREVSRVVVRRVGAQLCGAASLLSGCQLLLPELDGKYTTAGPEECVPTCGPEMRCDAQTRECVCQPLGCATGQCGAFVETRCGQPVDCGPCPSGQYCGSETPNQCSTAACTPKTCEQLGQTSGIHQSCGILVNCDPTPTCQGCAAGQTCTDQGCCTPYTAPESLTCGPTNDGCGHIVMRQCRERTELTCVGNSCCTPSDVCDLPDVTCGLNAACDSLVDCVGSCPNGAECVWSDAAGRHVCGGCVASCPPDPVCGDNIGIGCDNQHVQCEGLCPNPAMRCVNFKCCEPRCPATPTTCGLNDDGCGDAINCPGPCSTPGQACRAVGDGSFACSP